TTKDAIAHLLGTEFPTGKTNGNFNNHVGVPLSLLRLPDDCRAGVIEMGMNHAGEIRRLAEIAKPDIAVVTNAGYAHVEFFDSIDGIAAAKRELIEGLRPDGVAVLNADDPRVAGFGEVHRGRSVTFGFSEGSEVRAEKVEFTAAGSRFRCLGVDFENAMPGRHAVMNLLAAIAVAHVFEIAPERLRPAVAGFTVGNMRGERTLHRGIVIWNDCYNSNPEAAQSMLDVLRETPAARRIAVLGEMLELGLAGEELHRQVGRYAGRCAAGRGAPWWKLPRKPGSRRSSLRTRPRPATAPARWRALAMPSSSRGREASRWKRRWKGLRRSYHALFLTLRTALQAHQPAPRLRVHHLPHRLRLAHRALSVHRTRSLAHQQAALFSNWPVHPRGRPQIAPEEGRHPHHGRHPDHHLHRHPHAAVGGPQQPLRVDCHTNAPRLRLDRLSGRLRQGHQAAQSRPQRQAQTALPVHRRFLLRRLAALHAHVGRFQYRHELSVLQDLQTLAVDAAIDG